MISTDHRYRRTRVQGTLINITASQVMIICLVLIAYQRRPLANEQGARDVTGTRDD